MKKLCFALIVPLGIFLAWGAMQTVYVGKALIPNSQETISPIEEASKQPEVVPFEDAELMFNTHKEDIDLLYSTFEKNICTLTLALTEAHGCILVVLCSLMHPMLALKMLRQKQCANTWMTKK